jgi:hypothetical protein
MRAGVPVARIPQSLLRCVSATKLTQENKRPSEFETAIPPHRALFHSQPTAPVEKRLSAAVRWNVRIRNPIDGYGFKC